MTTSHLLNIDLKSMLTLLHLFAETKLPFSCHFAHFEWPFKLPKCVNCRLKKKTCQSQRYTIEIYIGTSVCSRDSRPRDWFRLGAIFMVSVSPNISRGSRDWGQPYMYFSTLQVILCQKHLFLHQLIQNMKTDCLLNYFIFNAVCVHQQIVMNVKKNILMLWIQSNFGYFDVRMIASDKK